MYDIIQFLLNLQSMMFRIIRKVYLSLSRFPQLKYVDYQLKVVPVQTYNAKFLLVNSSKPSFCRSDHGTFYSVKSQLKFSQNACLTRCRQHIAYLARLTVSFDSCYIISIQALIIAIGVFRSCCRQIGLLNHEVFSRTYILKLEFVSRRISTTDRSDYLIYALTTQVKVVVHHAHVLKELNLGILLWIFHNQPIFNLPVFVTPPSLEVTLSHPYHITTNFVTSR